MVRLFKWIFYLGVSMVLIVRIILFCIFAMACGVDESVPVEGTEKLNHGSNDYEDDQPERSGSDDFTIPEGVEEKADEQSDASGERDSENSKDDVLDDGDSGDPVLPVDPDPDDPEPVDPYAGLTEVIVGDQSMGENIEYYDGTKLIYKLYRGTIQHVFWSGNTPLYWEKTYGNENYEKFNVGMGTTSYHLGDDTRVYARVDADTLREYFPDGSTVLHTAGNDVRLDLFLDR